MSISTVRAEARARDVKIIEDNALHVKLVDGREIIVPLVWFPRLFSATPEQRADWRLIGGGEGIHWPQIDEDLSVAGFLRVGEDRYPAKTSEK